jgi:hypothetical protein
MNQRILFDQTDAELLEKVSTDKAFTLMRELNHKYGLKVYGRMVKHKDTPSEHRRYYMCDDSGFPQCLVFYDDEVFCYHTPYIAKERGSDNFDRHTYRSAKLSTLMGTIKKNNLVKSCEDIWQSRHKRVIESFDGYLCTKSENKYVRDVEGDSLHNLILAVKEGKSFNSLPQSDRDKYLELLDSFNRVDKVREEQAQKRKEFFGKCWVIGADEFGDYVVGKGSLSSEGQFNLEINTESFERVNNLEKYPEVLAGMTMLKVNNDSAYQLMGDNHGGMMPNIDRYYEDLDIVVGRSGYYTTNGFNIVWGVMPRNE